MNQFHLATAFLSFVLLFLAINSNASAQQSGNQPTQSSFNQIKRSIAKVKSLDQDLEKPQRGEWLAAHAESGQTFAQYLKIRPNVLTRRRNTLYIQPLGDLDESELKIVEATNEYLSTYFNCPVKMLDPVDLSTIPDAAKREFPEKGDQQLLTSHVLEKVLAPNLPEDAFATLAFTSKDLWPGDGWNFVFGYAAFRDRVGVWSLHRFGDPSESDKSYKKCLLRTIKLATHETGHMFSMQHCTNARCNMQGSNSLSESDTQPLHLCSQCHAKTCYAVGADPVARLENLKALCEKHGFEAEIKHYNLMIEKLAKKKR